MRCNELLRASQPVLPPPRCAAGTGALITPLADGDPNVMAVYSFTVDLTDPETPIIKRAERVNEDIW